MMLVVVVMVMWSVSLNFIGGCIYGCLVESLEETYLIKYEEFSPNHTDEVLRLILILFYCLIFFQKLLSKYDYHQ